jgi:chromate transporter
VLLACGASEIVLRRGDAATLRARGTLAAAAVHTAVGHRLSPLRALLAPTRARLPASTTHARVRLPVPATTPARMPVPALAAAVATGGLGALAWTAFKVGALAYGGGFVIVPLMRTDAVHVYHWMSGPQFLDAVALGQVTPGPVTHTVAAVGYAAAGLGGGLLAALVAFAPSFAFVLIGARRFAALRGHVRVRAFLDGAGPSAIGAIVGSAVPLALTLQEAWQFALLGLAALALMLRGSVVLTIVAAGVAGVAAALIGLPVPR